MWQQEFLWFFTIFHHEFRKNNAIAFEVLMVLAVAHLFGSITQNNWLTFSKFLINSSLWRVERVECLHVKKRMLLRFDGQASC